MTTTTPKQLAERVCAVHPPIRGGSLTALAAQRGNRLGLFLGDAIARVAGTVPAYPSAHWPLLITDTDLEPGHAGTVGTAFGHWVRLRTDVTPDFPEARSGLRALPRRASGVHDAITALIDDAATRRDPEQRARLSIALAWCDLLYRLGPLGYPRSPLASLAGRTPQLNAEQILAAAPHSLVRQVLALADVAEHRLIRDLTAATALRQPLQLDRPPVRAEGDVLADDLVLDLKTEIGRREPSSGRHFRLSPHHIRQLLAYVLLAPADWNVQRVGVYAARYGLTWTGNLESLLVDLTRFDATLDEWRAAFAYLWHDQPPPRPCPERIPRRRYV